MKYSKPVIAILMSARKAVQNSSQKQHFVILEISYPLLLSTSAAYETDE